MSPSYEDLHDAIKTQTNHIMELVKVTSVLETKMESMEKSHAELSNKVDSVMDKLPSKMTPDRCGHMHLELEQRIYATMRRGAKGWLNTVMVTLKIVALLSAIFAALGWGANSVGLVN